MIKIDKEYAQQVTEECLESSLRSIMNLAFGNDNRKKEEYLKIVTKGIVDQLENNSEGIGLEDCNGNEIFEGCLLEGFDRTFKVKYGIVDIEKVSPNKDINEVQIPCFYFEDTNDGTKVFPILKNYKGKNDLEDLKIK